MKRNTRAKPTAVKSKNGKSIAATTAAKRKPVDKQFRKYLDSSFTQKLIEHMHRAKKAALKDQE